MKEGPKQTGTPQGNEVDRLVADHVRRKEVDIDVCVERSERFAADITPVIEALKEMAAAGACDVMGRPIGWTVEPVAPEDTPGYRAEAFYASESVFEPPCFRPCYLKVGFLDGHGTIVNPACIIVRTVANAVHGERYTEGAAICIPHGSQVFKQFMKINAAERPGLATQVTEIAAKSSFYDHGHRLDEGDFGFSVASMPSEWVGQMEGWVRKAVTSLVDPAKVVKPEVAQELADKRASALMRLATIAAAKTCGRSQADVRAAYVGKPVSETASTIAGWFDRVIGR